MHFVSHFLKRVSPNKQAKKKGRPQKYEDALIITLWLFQILNNYSYRETLEKAKDEGFNVPSLCDYHYRVKQLDDELLKNILEECANLIFRTASKNLLTNFFPHAIIKTIQKTFKGGYQHEEEPFSHGSTDGCCYFASPRLDSKD
jgi:hypothetical protein